MANYRRSYREQFSFHTKHQDTSRGPRCERQTHYQSAFYDRSKVASILRPIGQLLDRQGGLSATRTLRFLPAAMECMSVSVTVRCGIDAFQLSSLLLSMHHGLKTWCQMSTLGGTRFGSTCLRVCPCVQACVCEQVSDDLSCNLNILSIEMNL